MGKCCQRFVLCTTVPKERIRLSKDSCSTELLDDVNRRAVLVFLSKQFLESHWYSSQSNFWRVTLGGLVLRKDILWL